jgi:NRPS condensation-like uncharacterized protein
MSFAQQRLWFLDQMTPQNAAYNIPATIHITTTLDLDALQRSLQAMIERHEVLHTTFAMIDGQPKQLIVPARSVSIHEIDLQTLPQIEREAAIQRLTMEAAAQPFDLSQGPLLRLTVLHLNEKEHMLVLVIHHIISDGWSIAVFFQELVTLYEAFSTNQETALPDLPVQYADFATWQQSLPAGKLLFQHDPKIGEFAGARQRPAAVCAVGWF